MFLLDGGILFGAYFGVRLIEKYRKKTRKNKKILKINQFQLNRHSRWF